MLSLTPRLTTAARQSLYTIRLCRKTSVLIRNTAIKSRKAFSYPNVPSTAAIVLLSPHAASAAAGPELLFLD